MKIPESLDSCRGGGLSWPFVWDGCNHETERDLVQCGLLGFCGCGQPDENLVYIRDRLAEVEAKELNWTPENRFFWYWADKEGLMEHGGAIPGWLTEDGKRLLAILKEMNLGGDEPEAARP